MKFSQFSKDRRADFVDYLCRRHGWDRTRAVEELEPLDEVALAYIGVEMKLARKSETSYDVTSENWELR